MYLPKPLRFLREVVREKQIQGDRLREFKSLLNRPVVDVISRAVQKMTGPHSVEETAAIAAIERRRNGLLNRKDSFRMVNYASDDQPSGITADVPVREAASWSQGLVEARFLFSLIRTMKPDSVMEMGSCVGISGAYIASAMTLNGRGHLWTLEGSPQMADLAEETFSDLGLNNHVTLTRGPFRDTLAEVIVDKKLDIAFIDGHHEGKATLRYFEAIKPHMAPASIILFDDIDWPDMVQAWKEIQTRPEVIRFAETKRTGIALF